MKFWDVASQRQLASLRGHTAVINAVAVSPDGHTVATASEDQTVQLRDLAGSTLIPRPIGGTLSEAFSPDGRTMATSSWDNTVKLWDASSHQQIATFTGHTDRVRTVTFSHDGRMLATTSHDGTVRVWNVATRQPTTLTEGTDPMRVAFSRDGHLLALGRRDGTATLWDVASHQPVATLTSHTTAIQDVTFSPDGYTLATAGADYTVRLWNLDTDRVTEHICGILNRIRDKFEQNRWNTLISELPYQPTCP